MIERDKIWKPGEWDDSPHNKGARVVFHIRPYQYLVVYINDIGELCSFRTDDEERIYKFAEQHYPSTIKIVGVNQ